MAVEATSRAECPMKHDSSCPSGHELVKCRNVPGGYKCRQCSSLSFQPNTNRLGDSCRLRRVCTKHFMRYKHHGSTTQDADCECLEGYHFENIDQRACVRNRECGKGYGLAGFGVCVKCIDQGMYSDTIDRVQECKPLTNCAKQSRCTLVESNGTFDNQCGPKVPDVTTMCAVPQQDLSQDSAASRVHVIAGSVLGVFGVFLIGLIVIFVFILKRKGYWRHRKGQWNYRDDCGPSYHDDVTTMCDKPQAATSQDSGDPMVYIIAGGLLGSLFLIFLILILIFLFVIRPNSIRRRKCVQKPLSTDQLEELKLKIIKECEKDSALCKKVLSRSAFVTEERIERQIWTLAQELYRPHPVQGMYELIVEKYKDSQHKYAVNGYLLQWKSWRGETKEAVAELFRCLRQCKRDDIVYEICNGLRHDVGFEVDMEASMEQDESLKSKTCVQQVHEVFCPCVTSNSATKASPKGKVVTPAKEKEKDTEASGKLLDLSRDQEVMDPNAAGVLYRMRPSPSAPEADVCNVSDEGALSEAQLALLRTYSQPVQATT